MPATNHFQFVRGEDVEIDWTVYTGKEKNAPVKDITGETLVFKVKRTDDDDDPSLVTSSTTLGVDPTSGAAKTTIAAAEMASLEEGDYRCALWRTSGSKACYSRGNFSVLGSVQD
jgi:hypothetical protein